MKNKLLTRLTLFIALILFVTIATIQAAFAQAPAIDTTLTSDPATIVTLQSIEALTVSITLILTYLSSLIPGIKKIKAPLIRAIAVGIIVVIAVVEFKFGWFTQDAFNAIINTLLPTFAYSGLAWQLLKTILGFAGIDLVSIQQNKLPQLFGSAPAKE